MMRAFQILAAILVLGIAAVAVANADEANSPVQ